MLLTNSKIDKSEWFSEWCPSEYSRKGTMLPLTKIEKLQGSKLNTGYCTQYIFSREDAEEIREVGNSRGLDRFAVGAWNVVIDLDNGDKQLIETKRVLDSLGLEYYVFFSGGKGYHIYIPQKEFMYSKHLPYSHKQFIKSLGLECDESLYQHGRLLSMVGRVHAKTGLRKKFVEHVKGDSVVVDIVEQPLFSFDFTDIKECDLTSTLLSLVNLVEVEPTIGNRHTSLWSNAMSLLSLGLSEHTVYELLYTVNNKWTNPKDDSEILRVVRQAATQSRRTHG